MCLIVFGYYAHRDYPLIVMANRDEYYHRPTEPLHSWRGSPIIAGRDMEKGGTWMGATKDGRFAAVTNVRRPEEEGDKRSRGELVKEYLEASDPYECVKEIHQNREEYGGYNLISGDLKHLYYSTNRNETDFHRVKPGIYGLSNASLDTPWPKVKKAKVQFEEFLRETVGKINPDPFFRSMSDSVKAPDYELPRTGVDQEREKDLSPIFINMEGYGTRSQTFLAVAKDGSTYMEERTYGEKGTYLGSKQVEWKIETKLEA